MNGIAIDERLLIRASAGTGKTYQLTNRFIARLLHGVAPSELLAVTFTRNAAAEILDRVLVRLAAAADDPLETAELAKALDEPDLAAPRCRELLGQVIDELQHLRVSTIDGYFNQVASSFSLELGLPIPWRVIVEPETEQLKRRVVHRLVRNADRTTLRRLVNLLDESEATRSIEAPLMKVVLKLHVAYRETTAEAWNWISPSARPSDRQLEDAVAALQAAPIRESWQSAHDKSLAEVATRNWQAFVESGLAANLANDKQTYGRAEIPPGVVAAYEPALELARTEILNSLAHQNSATRELLTLFDDEFAALKREERCLEYEDITRVLAEATLGTNTGRLAHRLNATVNHLLLDEFQDTSSLQWQVIEPLALDITAQADPRSFFCVGDEKQAIYGWRGGEAGIFGTLEDQLPGLEHEDLAVSFRSAPPVIETINEVFLQQVRHGNLDELEPVVREWTERYIALKPHHADRPGYACLRSLAGSRGSIDNDALTEEMARIIGETEGFDVGILVRQNKTVADIVARLRRRGIAASQEGGFALTDSAPVLVLLALARLADHPADSIAAFHVATSPLGPPLGLERETLATKTVEVSRRLRQDLANRGYGAVIGHWARELAASADHTERFRLSQLVRLATRFDDQASLRPAAFDQFVRKEKFGDPSTDRVRVMTIHKAKGLEFDVVILPELTASLSGKSGELAKRRPVPTEAPDRVCRTRGQKLLKLLPPDVLAVYRDDTLRRAEEALCVLYVAMTRAKYALHMLIPPSTKSEKTLPATLAGLLRAALTDGDTATAGAPLFEHPDGDPRWFESVPRTPDPDPEPDEAPLDISLVSSDGPRRRGRARRTPSGLEGPSDVDIETIFEAGSSAGMEHGTLVHAWLEQVDWLDDLPDDETLRLVAYRHEIHVDDLDDRLAGFRKTLGYPEIDNLLQPATYTAHESLPFSDQVCNQLDESQVQVEVRQEYTFAIDQDGDVLTGSIDRLVLLKHGDTVVAADTIDYKTDRVEGQDDIDRKVEYYRGQLEAYRDAVRQVFGLDDDHIATRLAFLGPGRVVEV